MPGRSPTFQHPVVGAGSSRYLAGIKKEMAPGWPKKSTINLVFHGHSVPASYQNGHQVLPPLPKPMNWICGKHSAGSAP